MLKLLVTAPWRRAPLLLLRRGSRAVLLAVLFAGVILGAAAAASPLFLSSAGNAALGLQVASRCPARTGVHVATRDNLTGLSVQPGLFERRSTLGLPLRAREALRLRERSIRKALGAVPHTDPTRLTIAGRGLLMAGVDIPRDQEFARLIYREGYTGHIQPVTTAGGKGVWVPAELAAAKGVAAGDQVRLTLGSKRADVRVAGTYRDLHRLPRDPFWCGQEELVYPPDPFADPPPAPLLVTDVGTFTAADRGLREETVGFTWEAQLAAGTTLPQARDTVAAARAVPAALHQPGTGFPEEEELFFTSLGRAGVTTELPFMVDRSAAVREAVRGAIGPVSLAGLAVALLLVAAAGSYWVERRRAEVRLLAARGAGPAAVAVKAALEMALPLAAGAAAGWAVALWLVRLIGPTDLLSEDALPAALAASGWALGAGVLLLGVVAALRARGLVERPAGGGAHPLARALPWEAVPLTLAVMAFVRLIDQGAPVARGGELPRIDLLLLAFPLLFLVGSVGLVMRGLGFAMPRLGQGGAGWPHAVYLAARRLAGSSRLALLLLAATAMSIGVLGYAAALTISVRTTLDAKARVFVGSDASVLTRGDPQVPPGMDATKTLFVDDSSVDGQKVNLLVIDSATFERGAFWDASLASAPLDELLASIAPREPGEPLPVLAIEGRSPPGDVLTVRVRQEGGSSPLPFEVVGTVRAFPGMSGDPLLIAERRALHGLDLVGERRLWVKGTPDEVNEALAAANITPLRTVTAERVLDVSNFLATAWTFGFMQTFGALIGLITIAGLLLYLETRQRGRQLSYAMARRMGLRRRSHWLSLLTEVGATLGGGFAAGVALSAAAAVLVYQRLDALPNVPPTPLLRLPVLAWAATGAAVLLVAWLGAWIAQRAADRANIAEVVRLAE